MRTPGLLALPLLIGLLGGCVSADAQGASLDDQPTPSVVMAQATLPEDFYDRAYLESLRVIEKYLHQSDLITADAGAEPERIRPLVSEGWFSTETSGFSHYRQSGEWTSGSTRFEKSYVQLARITPEKTIDVGVFGCVDTIGVFVLGPDHEPPPEQVSLGHPDYLDADLSEEDWELIQAFYDQAGVRFGDRRAIVFWLVGDTLDTLVIDSSIQWWGVHEC